MKKLFIVSLLCFLGICFLGLNTLDNDINTNVKFELIGYIKEDNYTKINFKLKNESNNEFINPNISLILSDKYERKDSYTVKSENINNVLPNSNIELEFIIENEVNLKDYNIDNGNIILNSLIKDKSNSNYVNLLFHIN